MTRWLIVLTWMVGCSSAPSAEAPLHSPLAAPPAENATLSLVNVPVREAMDELARVSNESLVIDPAAEPVVDCARISLSTTRPRPAAEIGALLSEALSPHGFALTHPDAGWILTHAGPVPAGCEEPGIALPRAASSTPPASPPPATGVVRATETTVARAQMDAWLAEASTFAGSARIVPHMNESGSIDGLRLFGIRRASPMAILGFENGDTVYTVNGHSLASPEAALEAYSSLRDVSELRVELERRGERVVHTIHITE